jgi:hypothetical protein
LISSRSRHAGHTVRPAGRCLRRGNRHGPAEPPALPPPRPGRGRGGRSVTSKVTAALTAGARAGAPLPPACRCSRIRHQRMRKRGDGLWSSTSSTTPKRGGRSVDSDSAATRSPVLRSMSHLHARSKHGRSPSVQPSLVALGGGGGGTSGHWWPPLGPPGFTEGPSSLLASVARGSRRPCCSKGGG